MKHFICIYYDTDTVWAARYDVDRVVGKNSPSLRSALLSAIDSTQLSEVISDHRDFETALRCAFRKLAENAPGEIFLSVVGYGPFEFESSRLRISKYARGAAAGTDLARVFKAELDKSEGMIGVTDAVAVACAGYWEKYTATEDTRSYTIASLICGVGVGGALVQKYGRPIGRAHHSEFGHTRIHFLDEDRAPLTICPHHKGCLQGVASWAAFNARARKSGIKHLETLFADIEHPLWQIQAKYIAKGCQTFMFTAPPFQIVLSGTMFDLAPHLVDLVWQAIQDETGEEFLYPAAQELDFVVHRPLVQEALLGGLHSGISAYQKVPAKRLERVK